MPIVHKNKFYLKAEGGKTVEFERVMKYDSDGKVFSAALPDWWSSILGSKSVTGQTENDLELAWHRAAERFEQLTQNKRKVIIYKFASSAILSVKKNGDYMAGCFGSDFDHVVFRSQGSGQEHSMGFTKGTALDVWFEVGYETSSEFEEFKSYVSLGDRKLGDSRDKDLRVMDWNAKREAFFVSFDLELSKLIYKLDTFLNGEAKKMASLIDHVSSAFALPLPENSEKKSTEETV